MVPSKLPRGHQEHASLLKTCPCSTAQAFFALVWRALSFTRGVDSCGYAIILKISWEQGISERHCQPQKWPPDALQMDCWSDEKHFTKRLHDAHDQQFVATSWARDIVLQHTSYLIKRPKAD